MAVSRAELARVRDDATPESVREDIRRHRLNGDLDGCSRVEPRCRVCQNPEVRQTVNRMLAHAMTYREIVDALGPINRALGKNKQIGYRSVWSHASKHFTLDAAAQSVFRGIAERRALQQNEDVVEGVGHLVNAYSYLETVMVKGYLGLVDEEKEVTVVEGMNAALKLREITREDSSGSDSSEANRRMDRIAEVMREVVPARYHAEIVARLDREFPPTPYVVAPGTPNPEVLDAEFEDDEDFTEDDEDGDDEDEDEDDDF